MQSAERCGGFDGVGPVLLLGDVLADEDGGIAQFGGELLALRFQHVADDDFGTFGDEQARFSLALSASAATDQDDFAG